MKKVIISKIEIRNFKATTSAAYEIGPGGIMATGFNGSGKSTIIEGILFALGASVEAGKVLNQTTKAPASVSLTIEADGETSVYTRTLVPTTDAAGKVISSTSNYTIDDNPQKAGEYSTRVAQLFGCRDWQYLLNPALLPGLKESRAYLLEIAGAPNEREFLSESNPTLAEIIGATHFADFEKQEKAKVESIGKKISAIPSRIEELSAMIENVEEINLTGVSERIEAINAELKGIDQGNESKADEFNKVANEAREMQYQGAKLRAKAAEKVAGANKVANKQVDEAEKLVYDWNRTRTDLSRQMERIKAEMNQARQDQATKENQLAESVANIQAIANECREIASRTPQADGNCTLCGRWCADLQAKGIEAAISANTQELDHTKKKGRNEVARRDQLQTDIEKINAKIDGLMSMEHEIESRINALGEAPKTPQRTVIESTPESLQLIAKATEMEEKAAAIIQGNRLEVTQHPADLVEELANLNAILRKSEGTATTQAQNTRIEQRIEELRIEESTLITTQLQHKQYIAKLKEFYKSYADSVTAMVNGIFEGTGYEIRLFEQNMGNDKGTPVMNPMKSGSANLSTAENLIFWKLFAERVMSKKFGIIAPLLVDNAESVDASEKLRSENQIIATRVERHELKIESIN